MTSRDDTPEQPVTSVSASQEFLRAMAAVVNRFSRENASNTPDYILAEFMDATLAAFEKASRAREKWYGAELKIGGSTLTVLSETAQRDAVQQSYEYCPYCLRGPDGDQRKR